MEIITALTTIAGVIVGVMVLIIGVVVYNSLSWGYVVLKMWGWFILPVFTTVPDITYWQAVGLTFCIALFSSQTGAGSHIKDEWEYKNKKGPVISMLVSPWTTLLTAYIIKEMFIK